MIVLDIPRSQWWSANDRLHWQAVRRKKTAVKTLARAAATGSPRFQAATLDVQVHYPTNGTADPHNIASTVLKAAIDGIVAAGVLPDDDAKHLTSVAITRGPKTNRRGIYRLTLTLQEAPTMSTQTEVPARCERCDHPHGTCHHTAPPTAVGDTIRDGMTTGEWFHANRLRSNSRARDAEGNVWVKTRRRDGAWENLTDGALWPLQHIVDVRQGYGPLTVEHVAGSR